jgi:hypothetical protein
MQELTPPKFTRLKTNIALNLTATIAIAILGVVTFLLFILVLADEYLSHRRGVRLRDITLGIPHGSSIDGNIASDIHHLRVNSYGGGRGEEEEGDSLLIITV